MKIVAVVPCYRVKQKIESVLASIDPAYRIVCVDDACPEQSGAFIASLARPNVEVLYHPQNRGVGGAVKTGYRHALEQLQADIVVKIDGDGQMPGEDIAALIRPLIEGRADYVKGNRFYFLRNLKGMPGARLFGNAALSFLTKLSSGYWDLMDPTNGFTAISRQALAELPLEDIDDRYFFESDMLCKLYLQNAVVRQYAMHAKYEDESSGLKPMRVMGPFLCKHLRNFNRRILYTYFVRDFNAGSLALLLSLLLGVIGVVYGSSSWLATFETGQARASGTVMVTALCLIFSLQFLLFFLTTDIQNNPNVKPR